MYILATRHEGQMQTERASGCVAKTIDRLSDGVVVGTKIDFEISIFWV